MFWRVDKSVGSCLYYLEVYVTSLANNSKRLPIPSLVYFILCGGSTMRCLVGMRRIKAWSGTEGQGRLKNMWKTFEKPI